MMMLFYLYGNGFPTGLCCKKWMGANTSIMLLSTGASFFSCAIVDKSWYSVECKTDITLLGDFNNGTVYENFDPPV